METDIILWLIVALLVLTVLAMVVGTNIIGLAGNTPVKQDPLFRLSTKAAATAEELRFLSPAHEYRVTVAGTFTFEGEMKDNIGRPVSSMDAFAMLKFKEQERKATINGAETFTITKETPWVDGVFAAVIVSEYTPAVRQQNPYEGWMNRYETFVLKDDSRVQKGNVIFTLDDVRIDNFDKLVKAPFPPCKAFIKIRCGITHGLSLRKCLPTDREYLHECDATLKACGGTVRVRAQDIVQTLPTSLGECEKKAKLLIKFDGEGIPDRDVSEQVEVSFWRSSQCTRSSRTLQKLIADCTGDFLGAETIPAPLIIK